MIGVLLALMVVFEVRGATRSERQCALPSAKIRHWVGWAIEHADVVLQTGAVDAN